MIVALQIGTVGQWATVAGVMLLAWIFYRGGGSTALSTLSEANRVLEKEVQRQAVALKAAERELSELRARTDYAAVSATLSAEIRQHDDAARAQWEQMLSVLELIAARLGPDIDASGE